MNFSFILISDYLNKSVYILANKSYKCLKKCFMHKQLGIINYTRKKTFKYIHLSLFVFINFYWMIILTVNNHYLEIY